ncbi:MAG: hypothetical protein RL095_616 [Verrucomicrobiota bacterium]|jgi:hypothetical protein
MSSNAGAADATLVAAGGIYLVVNFMLLAIAKWSESFVCLLVGGLVLPAIAVLILFVMQISGKPRRFSHGLFFIAMVLIGAAACVHLCILGQALASC